MIIRLGHTEYMYVAFKKHVMLLSYSYKRLGANNHSQQHQNLIQFQWQNRDLAVKIRQQFMLILGFVVVLRMQEEGR